MEIFIVATFLIFFCGAWWAFLELTKEGYYYYLIPMIACILLRVGLEIYADSKEYKEDMLQKCEWILENSQQYMLFGEPK